MRPSRVLMTLATCVIALCLAAPAPAAPNLPPIKHVFVINLENKGFSETWGPDSQAPFLATTLRAQGVLLDRYFGTAHESTGNYIAQISGQGPNVITQADCGIFLPFLGLPNVFGQAVGQGCVYPAAVPTVANQLQSSGRTWKGYMEDMAQPCEHPAIGALDDHATASIGDQYATRHNPFVYFHSIIDNSSCAVNDVSLDHLTQDLETVATTASLSYITPNLCDDGHDAPCVDGRPGGLTSANEWLQTRVPRILASPAFAADGMLVITFDESDGPTSDASACCGEGPTLNTPLPGILGLGGGRVGALVLSPFVAPGQTSSVPYNHYGLLRTIEDVFGLGHLGFARSDDVHRFGADVFG